MVFDVEEDVALPLEDHGLTDDLRKDVGAVVLGAYLGWEDLAFRLRLLDERGLVQRVKVALDTGGGEGHLDTGVVVAAEKMDARVIGTPSSVERPRMAISEAVSWHSASVSPLAVEVAALRS